MILAPHWIIPHGDSDDDFGLREVQWTTVLFEISVNKFIYTFTIDEELKSEEQNVRWFLKGHTCIHARVHSVHNPFVWWWWWQRWSDDTLHEKLGGNQ